MADFTERTPVARDHIPDDALSARAPGIKAWSWLQSSSGAINQLIIGESANHNVLMEARRKDRQILDIRVELGTGLSFGNGRNHCRGQIVIEEFDGFWMREPTRRHKESIPLSVTRKSRKNGFDTTIKQNHTYTTDDTSGPLDPDPLVFDITIVAASSPETVPPEAPH